MAGEGGAQGFIRFLLLLFIVGVGSIGGYRFLDNAGRFPHEVDTNFVIGETEWLTGEYRECWALARGDGNIAMLDCEHISDLVKPNNFHTFSTRYWGRIRRPEYAARQVWSWRCQRRVESVTCWALN